jgi:hypothetical protein
MNLQVTELEAALNSFDLTTRMAALRELVSLADEGQIELGHSGDAVNMHCHTFFSFNAYGYSPVALAWLARKRGFRAIGIVDFDVLDGVDEFLAACDLVGIRGSAGIETRVFIPQFATREINSPGEPGVYYAMGIGFTSSRAPGVASGILADMRARAERRNRDMLARINAHLDPVTIDYERDVLPLTPAGCATERHMLAAYIGAALARFGPPERPQGAMLSVIFWADKLGLSPDQVAASIADYAKFSNLVRARLMKRGGVGYVQPGPDAFPTIEEFHRMIVACGALPCVTWLDGTSAGEQAIQELLGLLLDRGAVALNIIPDRNWNIPDPEVRRLKTAKLYEIVEIAGELALPLNIGTEMNAPGQRLVDDFDAPELAPVRQAFLAGAHFIYGHTAMQRALGLGYGSAWATEHLKERPERNAFYSAIGHAVPPGSSRLAGLKALGPAWTPAAILAALS